MYKRICYIRFVCNSGRIVCRNIHQRASLLTSFSSGFGPVRTVTEAVYR